MKKPDSYHHGNLRAALLSRAVEVIGENGVEGVSLRSLARDLGVSHGAPARHFKSKAELLAAIAIDGYAQLTSAVQAAAEEEGPDPVLRMRAMARTAIRWARENKAYYSAINNPDVNRYAGDNLTASLSTFIGSLRAASEEAHAAGYWQEHDPISKLLIGISATIGASMIYSEALHYNVLGPLADDSFIETIVDQIAPLDP
jgi:AcrR family transcriptional regulator